MVEHIMAIGADLGTFTDEIHIQYGLTIGSYSRTQQKPLSCLIPET